MGNPESTFKDSSYGSRRLCEGGLLMGWGFGGGWQMERRRADMWWFWSRGWAVVKACAVCTGWCYLPSCGCQHNHTRFCIRLDLTDCSGNKREKNPYCQSSSGDSLSLLYILHAGTSWWCFQWLELTSQVLRQRLWHSWFVEFRERRDMLCHMM